MGYLSSRCYRVPGYRNEGWQGGATPDQGLGLVPALVPKGPGLVQNYSWSAPGLFLVQSLSGLGLVQIGSRSGPGLVLVWSYLLWSRSCPGPGRV